MADLINVGTFPNDATGDPARTAFIKVNGLAAGTVPFSALTVGNLTVTGTLALSGPLSLPNGSPSAPALAFANSPTTGIFRNGPDIFAIATAGVQRFGIDASGNATFNNPVFAQQGILSSAIADLGGLTINGAQNNVSLTLNNTQAGATANWRISSSATGSGFGAGLLVIGNSSTEAMYFNAAGTVTINPSSSGSSLVVGGNNAGIPALQVLAGVGSNATVQFDSTHAQGSLAYWTRNGGLTGYIGNGGVLGGALDTFTFRANTGLNFLTNNGSQTAATVASAGNWTMNAPTSGNTLTVNTLSGARGLQVNNSGGGPSAAIASGTGVALYMDNTTQGVGTPALRIDVSATTGSATPTGLGTVKPGAATAASSWLPINVNGTTMYIPLWL